MIALSYTTTFRQLDIPRFTLFLSCFNIAGNSIPRRFLLPFREVECPKSFRDIFPFPDLLTVHFQPGMRVDGPLRSLRDPDLHRRGDSSTDQQPTKRECARQASHSQQVQPGGKMDQPLQVVRDCQSFGC